MGTITWTCNLNTQKAWRDQGAVSLSGPSEYIPVGAKVTKVELSVYCGASNYNKSQECSFVLKDYWGNSIEIAEDVSWGSVNRVTVKVGGTPDQQLDWDNLSTIDIDGDAGYLNVRGTGTLTITYQEIELGYPTIDSATQTSTHIDISWSHVSYTGSATRKYNILASASGLWDDGYGTLGTDYTGTSASIAIQDSWRGKTLNLWLIVYADDYPTSKWSNGYPITIQQLGCIRYCYNGQWKECIPYYGVNGQWKECVPYYGVNNQWKELI